MQHKILFVISVINYGGAGKMLSFLANNLSSLGYNISIHTYASDRHYYRLNKKIKYIPAIKRSQNKLTKIIYSIHNIKKAIKEHKPDLIVSFLNNANFFSILCTSFRDIPVIICERSDPYYEKSIALSFIRSLYRFADGAVFQTDGAKKYYSNIVQKKSRVIPNPVTIKWEARFPIDKRCNEIAFVARFNIKQKRQDLMVKAFCKIIEHHKEIKLVFYGDGPDMHLVKEMVRENGLLNKVVFAGRVSDVQQKLKESKLFVLTSDYEGIPNALIEAMAVGLPVVSTDYSPGGAKLLIDNMRNGLIVNRGDVENIANAILFLLDNPETAEQYGKEAQSIIDTFNPNKVIDMWDEFIKDTLELYKI